MQNYQKSILSISVRQSLPENRYLQLFDTHENWLLGSLWRFFSPHSPLHPHFCVLSGTPNFGCCLSLQLFFSSSEVAVLHSYQYYLFSATNSCSLVQLATSNIKFNKGREEVMEKKIIIWRVGATAIGFVIFYFLT